MHQPGQSRRDLHRTGNHVYFRSHPLFFEVSGKNAGIRSGNLLTLKPLHGPRYLISLRQANDRRHLLNPKRFTQSQHLRLFHELIFTDNTQIGNSRSLLFTEYHHPKTILPKENWKTVPVAFSRA